MFLHCFYRKSLPKCSQNHSKICQDGTKIIQKLFKIQKKRGTENPGPLRRNVGSILGALLEAFWELFGLHFPSQNQIIFWNGFLIDFGAILEPKIEQIWDPNRIQDGVQEKSSSKAKTVKTIGFLYII